MAKWAKPKTMEEVEARRFKFRPKLTPQQQDEIEDLFWTGKLTNKLKRELADKYGCNIKTIWRTAHREMLRKRRLYQRYGASQVYETGF